MGGKHPPTKPHPTQYSDTLILLHGNISIVFLFIALEITDPFSFQTLDKHFNLHSSFYVDC